MCKTMLAMIVSLAFARHREFPVFMRLRCPTTMCYKVVKNRRVSIAAGVVKTKRRASSRDFLARIERVLDFRRCRNACGFRCGALLVILRGVPAQKREHERGGKHDQKLCMSHAAQ